MAAIMNGCDNLNMYRGFGRLHTRLLLNHMTNLTYLEKELDDLDKQDLTSDTSWRLKTTRLKDGWDPQKKDAEARVQQELLEYGRLIRGQA